ncbi:MAG: cytochrome P450, partial [Saccharopolyspora sp.]|uniref:cytochrome P450 n=1 Tax=Saccharopolyspora sp. TaxID=33915 RepID=UPI0025E381AD
MTNVPPTPNATPPSNAAPNATLPPGPSTPRSLQAVRALFSPRLGLPRLRARYGDTVTIQLPVYGKAVVISDPADVKQLYRTSPEIADKLDASLGRVLGSGSLFSITGEQHRKQRKLLVPPFHGRRLGAYERIVEQEALAEFAQWPQDRLFATLPSMRRLTLNIILRAVFGARAAESDRLRELLPRLVTLGSKLVVLPVPANGVGPWNPWQRFRELRAEYDRVIAGMIDRAEQDADVDERDDVLALLLQSRYDDGSRMDRGEIADQLLTLLSAGHETITTTLAWAVERLRRHPAVLRELTAEVDAGGSTLRAAAIIEVQRTRPVVILTERKIKADGLQLGRWWLPKDSIVFTSIDLMHRDPRLFPDPDTFDPHRFVDAKPDAYQWIPFGGGNRRCIGAAFAT